MSHAETVDLLRQVRTRFTQRQIAEDLKVHEKTVQRWELPKSPFAQPLSQN